MPQYFIIILWGLLLAWLWFKMIKPQKAKQQQVANLQQNVAVGDRIVTIGGLTGTVTYVGDTDFNLDVNGITLTLKKWAIGSSEPTPLETEPIDTTIEPIE